MVITILEASVDRENWQALRDSYNREIKKLDPGIVRTYLIQAKGDESIWRILTLWESQEVLERMRASGQTPRGVVMFRQAQAEPTLSVFNVISDAAS